MAGAAFPLPKKRKVFTADRPILFAIIDTTYDEAEEGRRRDRTYLS